MENKSQSGCTGKFRYPTFAAAAKAARNSSRRKDYKSQPYKCAHCLGFHMGSTLGRLSESRKRRLREIEEQIQEQIEEQEREF